jgi:hypothetical protein
VPTKTSALTKGQGGYFNLQAENTTDFKSILPLAMIWIISLLIMKTLQNVGGSSQVPVLA